LTTWFNLLGFRLDARIFGWDLGERLEHVRHWGNTANCHQWAVNGGRGPRQHTVAGGKRMKTLGQEEEGVFIKSHVMESRRAATASIDEPEDGIGPISPERLGLELPNCVILCSQPSRSKSNLMYTA
jgi:hypothetical protein